MLRILRQILQRHILLKEFGWSYLAIMCHVAASVSNNIVFIEELIQLFSDLSTALLLIVSHTLIKCGTERVHLLPMSGLSQCMITVLLRLGNILQLNCQLRYVYTVKKNCLARR
jgi:hypothetical protein